MGRNRPNELLRFLFAGLAAIAVQRGVPAASVTAVNRLRRRLRLLQVTTAVYIPGIRA